MTAAEILKLIFGDLPLQEVGLTAAETLAHLEALEKEGKVIKLEKNNVRHYRIS